MKAIYLLIALSLTGCNTTSYMNNQKPDVSNNEGGQVKYIRVCDREENPPCKTVRIYE